MTEEKLQKLKDIIKSRYKASHCGYTEFRSEGNSTDVFSDGVECGTSQALYDIAFAMGFADELEEPEEPEYDF